jgi:nicotinamidase/pyrazinamidase
MSDGGGAASGARDALVVVDVQNDFLPPHGALAVPGGDEVIRPINDLLAAGGFDLVVATRDWHPPDHASFDSQGGPWPVHCVRDTAGAQISPAIDRAAIDAIIDKGTAQGSDGYSAFESTQLSELLRDRQIELLTITGLATDVCVKHTALEALQRGLRVRVPTAAVRGIDASGSEQALAELAVAGAQVI